MTDTATATLQLIVPSLTTLPTYAAALAQGWVPNTTRGEAGRLRELERIRTDPQGFLVEMDDRAGGAPMTLPDGSQVPRLPGFRRWLWDGEFCGSVLFRWQPGTHALPPYSLGHIGYNVVPWKRRRGYAGQALALMLAAVREASILDYVELTTDAANLPSQKVVLAQGCVLVERFQKPDYYGGGEALRFRITL